MEAPESSLRPAEGKHGKEATRERAVALRKQYTEAMQESFQLGTRELEGALAEWKEMEAELIIGKAAKKLKNKGYRRSEMLKKLKRKRDADVRALTKETMPRQFRDEQLQVFERVRRDAGVYISAEASERGG